MANTGRFIWAIERDAIRSMADAVAELLGMVVEAEWDLDGADCTIRVLKNGTRPASYFFKGTYAECYSYLCGMRHVSMAIENGKEW